MRKVLIAALFVLGCVVPYRLFAQKMPAVHVSAKPAWISTVKEYHEKPPARLVQNGYFYALVERQLDVEKQADYHHVVKEIVSGAGIQNGSQVSVSFDPSYERLDFHQLTVWRDGKPQNRLNAADFKVLADEQDMSKFIYQGSFSAVCILSDIRKGDWIEYSYTLTGSNPVFSSHFCSNIYLQWGQPIAHQYFLLTSSSARKLNLKSFNNVVKPVVTDEKGTRRYVWEAFQVQPWKDLDNTPAWYDDRPLIQISEYDSWAEVINWASKVNPIATNIKGNLAIQIAKLKADAKGDQEKYFRAAVKVVQDEVRYMGIEIGEYSHRANRPEKVFDQRYGDCKDKSLLLASMLRANGIEADMVLVNTDLKARVDTYLPTTAAFDHAVVRAVLKGKEVWVDATIAYQRGTGTNIYFPEYGKGLLLRPGNTGLVVIPLATTGNVTSVEQFTVKNENTPVKLDVKTTYTLSEADVMRDRLASNGIGPTERDYLKYYAKAYPLIESRDSLIVTDDEDKNILTIIEKYKVPDFFKRDSVTGKYTSSFYQGTINDLLPNVGSQYKTPVSVSYPNNVDYTTRVILPGGWNVAESHEEIKRDAYRFADDINTAGDTLSLRYRFAYLKDFVPAEKRDEFRKDIKEISDNRLSYAFSYNTGDQPIAQHTNTAMVLFALILMALLGVASVLIYRRETPGIVFSYGASFMPIGGWLVLFIIGLIGMSIYGLSVLVDNNCFTLETWNLYGSKSIAIDYKSLLVFTITGNISILCYTIFCLVLMINKRDIFPKALTGCLLFSGFFYLIAFVLTLDFKVSAASVPSTYSIVLILMAIVWMAYLKKLDRVEATFIVPHPPDNFSYEGPGTSTNAV